VDKHHYYLSELCKLRNLEKIGVVDVEVILIEPTWFAVNIQSTPDILIAHKNGNWTVIELKGTTTKRHKARKQIKQGVLLLQSVLGVQSVRITGKFVVYHPRHGYSYEDVYKRRRR